MATNPINPRWRAAAVGILALIALSLFNHTSPMLRLDSMVGDFAVYHRKVPRPTGTVIIGAIDDQSIAEFGRWPWRRSMEARLIDALREYKVAVIGFDMVFSESDSESDDRALARAMKAQGSTYIGYYFNPHPLNDIDRAIYKTTFRDPPPLAYNIVRQEPDAPQPSLVAGGHLPPIPELNGAAAGIAFLNIDEDPDGVVRSYPTVVRFNGLYCIPLFLALGDAYLHNAQLTLALDEDGVAAVEVGNRLLPVDERGRMTLYFRGPAGTIPKYSVSDILNHRVSPGALAGRVIVIGVTALGLGDRFITPVGSGFPGVEVLATAVDNVISGDLIHRSQKTADEERIAGWVLGIIVTFSAAFATAGLSFALMLVLIFAYVFYAIWLLASDGTLIGMVLPCFTAGVTYFVVVSLRYAAEGRRGEFLARFVSPQLARSMAEWGLAGTMQQNRVQLSVVACDLRGFTAFSENAAPEELMHFLRDYYQTVGRVVTESGGSIYNFAGDGIISLVGAPVSYADHATRAIRIALQIWNRSGEMLEMWRKLGLQVGLGVGVASGFVTVGTIASSEHLEYTVVGPAVNLAARLCSHAESGQVLVDHRTVGLVGDNNQLCEFENIGTAELKGFVRPVELFVARTRDTPHCKASA